MSTSNLSCMAKKNDKHQVYNFTKSFEIKNRAHDEIRMLFEAIVTKSHISNQSYKDVDFVLDLLTRNINIKSAKANSSDILIQ